MPHFICFALPLLLLLSCFILRPQPAVWLVVHLFGVSKFQEPIHFVTLWTIVDFNSYWSLKMTKEQYNDQKFVVLSFVKGFEVKLCSWSCNVAYSHFIFLQHLVWTTDRWITALQEPTMMAMPMTVCSDNDQVGQWPTVQWQWGQQ